MKYRNGRSHPAFNVIYFFDGGKTRTFKVSSLILNGSFVALILLFLWASVAGVLCFMQMKKIARLSERLEQTLTVVFQNEVQKGHVYENLYDEKKSNPIPEKTISLTSESNISSQDEASKQQTNLLNFKHFKLQALNPIKSPVVENPVLTKSKDQVSVSFIVKNTKSQGRSEGVIWMMMEWINADGTVLKVSTQDALDTSSAVYSIRQQKEKKFTFKMPNSTAILSKLELCFKSREGQTFQFQVLPKSLTDAHS